LDHTASSCKIQKTQHCQSRSPTASVVGVWVSGWVSDGMSVVVEVVGVVGVAVVVVEVVDSGGGNGGSG
jgi:hypothetical protein